MKHLEEYNSIIEYRKSNPLPDDVYGENHHIVPRSICPLLKDSKDNIVRLSAQEHFLAHYHLWKAYRDELKEKAWARKMCFAFCYMKRAITKCDNVEKIALLYAEVREDFCKALSEAMSGKPKSEEQRKKMSEAKLGKHFSEEHRRRISESLKGRGGINKGKHFSEETRKKMSESHKGKVNGKKWFNNGVICVRTEKCPEGFKAGRIKK